MSKRTLRIALVTSLSLLLLGAAPALAAPDPSFTVSPNPPVSGQSATYTSTSTTDLGFAITTVEWDFENDGTFVTGGTATHTYPTAGAKTFTMRVTDTNPLLPLGTTEAQTVTVAQANRAPTALFDFSPVSPFIGDDVLFASNASDPDSDSLKHLWNFGDGVTSPLRNPTHAFSDDGTHTVTLTVTDPSNAADSTTRQVVVLQRPVVEGPKNKPPVARFAYGPRSPEAGKPVEFASSAVDPEGELRSLAWDLDGDGQFDDARGEEVVYTYLTPGVRQVRLRAEDAAGLAAVEQRAVPVAAAPKPRPGFLRPDPKVQFNGLILAAGFRLKELSVRAPQKALVTVRCKGRSCPAKQRRKRIKKRPVRFRTFERFLRAGVRLEIFVTKPGTIGEYTRYAIRAGKAPKPAYGCAAARGKPHRIPCGS